MSRANALAYIATITAAAVESTEGTGLFPSVMIAQAALESGWGKSTLTKLANNHFGIKADKSWKGEVYGIRTREEKPDGTSYFITANFRKYPSTVASFIDRNNFLLQNPRYRANGVFAATTPEQQAEALQRAGYATANNYAQVLIGLINTYNLKAIDVLAAQKKTQDQPSPPLS